MPEELKQKLIYTLVVSTSNTRTAENLIAELNVIDLPVKK